MKIKHRRATASDYSSRAARAEAKKIVLGLLADALADAKNRGFPADTPVPRSAVDAATSNWTADWQSGTRRELAHAVAELSAEFERRSGRGSVVSPS
jgi:hypothetical protein